MNKSLVTYSIISFLIISFFGFNVLFSLLGNILILLFLTPILLVIISFLGINAFKLNLNKCDNCGSNIIGNQEICLYCGYNLNKKDNTKNSIIDASREIIEIDAEEIK